MDTAKDSIYHHCGEVGHWWRNSPAYLTELNKKKNKTSMASTSGALNLYMGNGMRVVVEAIGSFDLILLNGLIIVLDNCHYVPTITIGYALEFVACILNMVPTKKVEKTPYKSRHGKVPNLSYLKSRLISQEGSGSNIDLEEIQDEDSQPSENTREHHVEVEHEDVKPQSDIVPIHRSARIPQIPERCGFYIHVEEHETVGRKWLFKKKTDMDSNVHTYKARLVAKGNTQTFRIDYEETFSPVAETRAIRILIAISAYYDYEIWQMDVKPTFLNGYLNEDIYMVNCNKRFDEEIKTFGFTQNLDEASGSIVTFLILYVDDILIIGNNIPMLQDVKSWLGKCFAMKDLGERFKMENNARDTKLGSKTQGGDLERELRVICYTNVGFGTDKDDRKSQPGYVSILNGGTIDWKSARLLVGPTNEEPIKIYCGNSGATIIANEPGVQRGSLYYQRKVNYVQEVIEMGEIHFLKVYTYDNLVDSFTKPLSCTKHTEHAMSNGFCPANSLIWIRRKVEVGYAVLGIGLTRFLVKSCR
ncbi:retrotransposon protein, putative, ty1-copia subclass [Tanacetum coccineum]|uniref:Retrotransposon protein, putative, ty1-copia subclass n=1 Tax=Tanacetum coccineum TaxID=301880 RepID=A0ABQ4ZJ96_9ASTR